MKQLELGFNYGVTREQACIMCRLGSECGGCCERCRAEGRNDACYGQACSLPTRHLDGRRWEAWLSIAANSRPCLRKYLPRKYWKCLKKKRL